MQHQFPSGCLSTPTQFLYRDEKKGKDIICYVGIYYVPVIPFVTSVTCNHVLFGSYDGTTVTPGFVVYILYLYLTDKYPTVCRVFLLWYSLKGVILNSANIDNDMLHYFHCPVVPVFPIIAMQPFFLRTSVKICAKKKNN